MHNRSISRALGVLVVALLFGISGACGTAEQSSRPPRQLLRPSSESVQEVLTPALINAEINKLANLPTPRGVPDGTWQLIKSTFGAELEGNSGRSVSVLPDPDFNVVSDLELIDDGAGGWNLTWTYRNRGDYDLNGEVNIADLSPIGLHFHSFAGGPNWDVAQVADGDTNGEVNIADIVPIGGAFHAQALGYNIYGADSQEGPWNKVASVPLGDASVGFPRRFNFNLGPFAYAWILLTPYDGAGADWVSSGPLPPDVYQKFNTATSTLAQATHDYYTAYNTMSTTNLDTLNTVELDNLAQNFIDKGEAWVAAATEFNTQADALSSLQQHGSSTVKYTSDCTDEILDAVPDVGGVGLGPLNDVSKLTGSANDKIMALRAQYPGWKDPTNIDDYTKYRDAALPILKEMAQEGGGITGQAVSGAFGGFAGAGVGTVICIAKGIVVTSVSGIGIVVLTGAGGAYLAGKAFKWLYYGASKTPQSHSGSLLVEEPSFFAAGSLGNEEGFIMDFPPGGTFVVSVEGYAPIVVNNFKPPTTPGKQMQITLQLAEIDAPDAYSEMQITTECGQAVATTCLDILGVSIVASPPDPGPYEGVTVTATVLPVFAGCSVSYAVQGTDGYSQSGSPGTDGNGQISFYIPGGAEGVHDAVSVEVNGRTASLAYVF